MSYEYYQIIETGDFLFMVGNNGSYSLNNSIYETWIEFDNHAVFCQIQSWWLNTIKEEEFTLKSIYEIRPV